MGQDTLRGFNTQLQEVDDRYSWINDMIKARQDLVLMYMKLLNLTLNCTPFGRQLTDGVFLWVENVFQKRLNKKHWNSFNKVLGIEPQVQYLA